MWRVGIPAFFSSFQSIGSPVGSSSMVGHASDHSLSGHTHTFTFSSTEVRLCFPPFLPLTPFPTEHSYSSFLFFLSQSHSFLTTVSSPLTLSSFLPGPVSGVPSDVGRWPSSHQQQQSVAKSTHLGVGQPAGLSMVKRHEHGSVHVPVH